MTETEKTVIGRFRSLLTKRLKVHALILFGSRARGDASLHSDMDLVVILGTKPSKHDADYISECAWEAGFEHGIVLVPVVFSRDEWESGPESRSLLAIAVKSDGVAV